MNGSCNGLLLRRRLTSPCRMWHSHLAKTSHSFHLCQEIIFRDKHGASAFHAGLLGGTDGRKKSLKVRQAMVCEMLEANHLPRSVVVVLVTLVVGDFKVI